MADSSEETSDRSKPLSLKHITGSLFSIPGFFVGFGSKGSSELDSGKSPTSTLDFGVLRNFGGLFSPGSPILSSSKDGHRNKWYCGKVGLSIVNSFGDETEDEDLDDFGKSDYVVLAPQVKIKTSKKSKKFGELLGLSLKSNSLPKNYVASLLSNTESHLHESGESNFVLGDEGMAVEPSSMKPSSSPKNIVSSRAYTRSLSAREVTLSEDYTCIISHGPNPTTTHIFGDQILDCDPNEFGSFDPKEEAKNPKEDLLPNPSDDFSGDCSLCKKKLQDDYGIDLHREEKAFCGFRCRSHETFAEEETRNTNDRSLEISPGSSFNEDIFPMGMPLRGGLDDFS